MPSRPCRRAYRVSGAPAQVVAWVDYDQTDRNLCLSATHYSAEQVAAINELLAKGSYTAREVIAAITSTKGDAAWPTRRNDQALEGSPTSGPASSDRTAKHRTT